MQKYIKRATVILLSLLLCICITGCGANSGETTTTAQMISSTSKIAESTENTSKIADTTTTKKAEISTTESATTTTKKETTTTRKLATTTTKKSTISQVQTTTQKEGVCYLTIECKAILNNMDKLADAHEKYVPKNGYIVKDYECILRKGDTVFDVLRRACKIENINLNATNTGYGIYVAGINNLDEFDCGQTSGWMYSVNGVKPPYSCNKHIANQGDKIVFSYTC